jgi:hypothetical protein
MEHTKILPEFGSLFLGIADHFKLKVEVFQELHLDGTGPDFRVMPLDRCPGARVVCAPRVFVTNPDSELFSDDVPPMLIAEIPTDRDPHIVAAGFIEALKSPQGLSLFPDPDHKFLNGRGITIVPCLVSDAEILERLRG